MTAQRNHFVSDFPGVFATKVFSVLAVVFWPWVYLHGTARFAAGIPWTATALAVAALIARAKLNASTPRRRR